MIRKHIESDLEQILDVWNESSAIAHSFLNSDFVEKVRSDMRNIYVPDSDTWVYEIDSQVVGFVSMLDNEIGGLFVSPAFQSKGIGSSLVNFVRDFHDNLQVEVFEKNNIGRAFYDKYGFTLIKRYHHEQSGERVWRLKFEK